MAGHRTQYRCLHLGDLVERCLGKNLTHAALTGRGLQQLLARLRVTDGGTAPRGLLLPLATAPSMDLGVRGSLPLINGVTGAGTRQMEIRHDLSTTAITPGSADGYARAQVAASASANASVLVSAKASAPVPKSASTKVRSAAYLQKQANTACTQYAAKRDADAYKPRANALVKDFKRARAKGSEHSPTGRSRRLRFAAFLYHVR